jgi:tetratricopeptide (TPR) repeat protein
MKKLFALLLLLSFALAQSCQEKIDNGVASTQANYTAGKYEYHARLGEVYENGADCFNEGANSEQARFYYTLAGDNYTQAAILLDQDFQMKASIFYSAGECYKSAGRAELAIDSFRETVELYDQHPLQVEANLSANAQDKIRQMSLLNETKFTPPEEIPQQDMLFIAILAVAVVAVISAVLYTQARRP